MSHYRMLLRRFSVFLVLCYSLVHFSVYAAQFDQDYLKWKTAQEEQDKRLSQAPAQDQYYLARPTQQKGVGGQTKNSIQSGTNSKATDKISLNMATVEQLQSLSGIGLKKAQAIIDYRQQHGKFKTIDELQNVKGIGPAILAKNRSRLSL